jgi:hypothetical protein
MIVTNDLTFTNGYVNGPGSIEMQGATMTVVSGWDGGNCNIKFTETADQALTVNDTDFLSGTVTINKSSGTLTSGGTATWTLPGALTIQEGILSLGSNTTFNGGVTIENGGTLTCTTGGTIITIDDADIMTVNSGGNLTFQGASGNLITFRSDTTSAFDLTMNGSYTMDYVDVTYSDASSGSSMIASNSTGSNNTNWIIVAGAVRFWDGGGSTNNWSEAANWAGDAVPGTTELVAFSGSSTPDPTKDCTFDNAGTWSGGSFYITNGYSGTITLSVDMNVATYYQADGTFACGARTLTVTGDFTKEGGTFNEDTGTLIFGGTTNGTFDVATTETFNNVTINKTDATNNILTITSGDTMLVAGILELTDGQVNTGTIEAQGAVNVGASFNQGDSNIILSGTAAQVITMTGDNFPTGTLTVNKASNTATTSGTLTLAGALTIQEGTLSLGGNTNFNGGITVEAGGTLSCTTGGTTITIDDADTVTVNANGVLTLQGADPGHIILTSDTTAQWSLVMNGTYDLDYVTVSYSDASGGHTMFAANSTDGGNNTNWVFNTGATITWDGSSSSDWFTAANWDLNRNPIELDDVVIDLNSTVNLPSGTTIKSLTIGNASGTTSPTLNFIYDAITDGALVINGGNLTVYTNATITHSAGTTVVVGTVNISVQTGDAIITGSINLDGLGYRSAAGPGTPSANTSDGGAYGGVGGDSWIGAYAWPGTTAVTYGSITAPVDLGSGGATSGGTPSGCGGGAVQLTIGGAFTITGTISANGTFVNYAGGSGGSIYVTASSISGAGTIQTNGGSMGQYWGGGGGGGRIAVILTDPGSDFSGFTGTATAYGGTRANSEYRDGAAGTLYLQTGSQASGAGSLIIDNGDRNTYVRVYTMMPASVNLNDFSEIIIRNKGVLAVDADDTLDFGTANITTEGMNDSYIAIKDSTGVSFPSPYTISGYTLQPYQADLTFPGDLILAADGAISADGAGYCRDRGPGTPTPDDWSGMGRGDGGAYGGIGGDYWTNIFSWPGITTTTYGSITAPTDLGSGGGNIIDYSIPGGDGGGSIRLIVTGTFTVSGTISANGTSITNGGGGGSGGSIYVTAAAISGNGTIRANGGGQTNMWGGGGGGGRIAIILTDPGSDFSSFSAATITAYGGLGYGGSSSQTSGAAGTLYMQTGSQAAGTGTLTIDNTDRAAYKNVHTLMPVAVDVDNFSEIIIRNKGMLAVDADDTLDFGAATITAEGMNDAYIIIKDATGVSYPGPYTISGYTLQPYQVNLTFPGDLIIAADGAINVDGLGYSRQSGSGAPTSNGGDGGAYGGIGGDYSGSYGALGTTAVTYGSITTPTDLGSGGANTGDYSVPGGDGGGALQLTIGGDFVIAGTISANGTSGAGGGGSGGSIYITAVTISGAGTIQANGGVGGTGSGIGWGGGGGGGRIAIILTGIGSDFSGLSGLVNAYGGACVSGATKDGAAGTIYKQTQAQGNNGGELIIDNTTRSVATDVTTDLDGLDANSTTVGYITLQNNAKFNIGSDDSLTIQGSGQTITINTGTSLINKNILNIGGSTFVVNGTVDFTTADNTVTYTGQSDDTGATLINATYHHLVINNTGTIFSLGADLTANGDLIVTAGTLRSDGYEMDCNGNVDVDGTLNIASGTDGDTTMNVAGSWDLTGGALTSTNSTVVFDGAAAQSIISSSGIFNNIQIGVSGVGAETYSVSTSDDLYVNGTFSIGADADDSVTFDITDDTVYFGGSVDLTRLDTFTVTLSTVIFNGVVSLTSAGKPFNDVEVGTLTVPATVTAQDVTDIDGNFTVRNGTFDANDQVLTIDGSTTINGGILKTGAGTITFGNDPAVDTLTISSGELQIESNDVEADIVISNLLSWTNSGGTITYLNCASSTTRFSDLAPYYNLTINSNGNSYSNNAVMNIAGNLTLTNGTLSLANNMNVAGAVIVTGGYFTSNSNTLTLSGPGATYNNSDIDASHTTWTGGTLNIQSNTNQTLPNGETYNILELGRYDDVAGTTLYTRGTGFSFASSGLTIDPNARVVLTLTGALADDKPYDGTVNATAILSSDTITGFTDIGYNYTGSFDNKNVGINKDVTIEGVVLTGTDANKYQLASDTIDTTATITQAGLTVTGITADNKVYDGTTNATLNTAGATLNGVFGLDAVTLNITAAAGTFIDKEVGNNKTVTISGLTINGADSANYSLTQPTTTANITAAPTPNPNPNPTPTPDEVDHGTRENDVDTTPPTNIDNTNTDPGTGAGNSGNISGTGDTNNPPVSTEPHNDGDVKVDTGTAEGNKSSSYGFDYSVIYNEEDKKYKRHYKEGRYRTVVIVFEGKVLTAPYSEKGVSEKQGVMVTAGQRVSQTLPVGIR